MSSLLPMPKTTHKTTFSLFFRRAFLFVLFTSLAAATNAQGVYEKKEKKKVTRFIRKKLLSCTCEPATLRDPDTSPWPSPIRNYMPFFLTYLYCSCDTYKIPFFSSFFLSSWGRKRLIYYQKHVNGFSWGNDRVHVVFYDTNVYG